MGAWGPAIFSDDTASDVRDDFRDLTGDGLSPADATARLLAEYHSSLDDPDDGPPFWLGLAVAQWKAGRLQEDVKARARVVIDSGADLRRWSGTARLTRARQAVLGKTREMLLSAQPAARPIARACRQANDWAIGELVSYRSASGKYVVLRVLGHHVDKGGTAPEMDLLDYYDAAPPGLEAALALAPRPMVDKQAHTYELTRRFMVGATSAREMPAGRLQRLGVRVATSESHSHAGQRVLFWRPGRSLSLDTFIERVMQGPVIWRPGPGGDDHERWTIGDVFAYRTDAGKHALFQFVDRYRSDGLDGAPIVAALDAFPGALPELAQVPARAIALTRATGASLGFVLVNDGTDGVPASSLMPIGNLATVADRMVPLFASVPMAVWRVERTMNLRSAQP